MIAQLGFRLGRLALASALFTSLAGCPSDPTTRCADGAAACSSNLDADVGFDGSAADAGQSDGNVPDSGVVDSGVVDSGVVDSGVRPDAGQVVCVPVAGIDEPDVDHVDSDCDGVDGDVEHAVFVSADGSDSAPGTREAPFATIGHALSSAGTSAKTQVLVSEGTYVESIALRDGISIHGGYRAIDGWSRHEDAATVITFGSPVVVAELIVSTTRLSRISIVAANAVADGESSVAMIVRESTALVVEDSNIVSGKGAAGAAGSTPVQPLRATAGTAGGMGGYELGSYCPGTTYWVPDESPGTGGGGTVPYCNRGGNGVGLGETRGLAGSVASAGACMGGTPTTPTGAVGAVGVRGVDGTPGAAIGTFSSAGYVPAVGSSGLLGGVGAGGGGGATGWTFTTGTGDFPCYIYGGRGGGGGAGGLGGAGGAPAQGGGASVALFLWTSTIDLRRVVVRSGTGGAGGQGGPGGAGGFGGYGGPGGPARVLGPNFQSGPGDAGGEGGQGGQGGGGGGGSGGPSVGVLLGGQSTLPAASIVVFQVGNGGAGGLGGGADNSGFTGEAHAVLTLP